MRQEKCGAVCFTGYCRASGRLTRPSHGSGWPHLCTCPGQVLSPSLFSFHMLVVWFSIVLQPLCHFPLKRCSLSLPLLLVCSPQILPAPQPVAVSPCTGPHCTEPHEVEPYQHFWSKESETSYCKTTGEIFDMLPASEVIKHLTFTPPLNSQKHLSKCWMQTNESGKSLPFLCSSFLSKQHSSVQVPGASQTTTFALSKNNCLWWDKKSFAIHCNAEQLFSYALWEGSVFVCSTDELECCPWPCRDVSLLYGEEASHCSP